LVVPPPFSALFFGGGSIFLTTIIKELTVKSIRKYLKLERHAYAPELNKVHLFGETIAAQGVATIQGAIAVARKHLSVKEITKGIAMQSDNGSILLPNSYTKHTSLPAILYANNRRYPKCKAVKIVSVSLV
tara:strand:+ start:321 stop:713 length:393 start_codon:yes stop_codon:yes gene_type:complete